ncbi:hypothetical protein CALCODRAFT_289747, partial [Calocera cornea HHB12733]
ETISWTEWLKGALLEYKDELAKAVPDGIRADIGLDLFRDYSAYDKDYAVRLLNSAKSAKTGSTRPGGSVDGDAQAPTGARQGGQVNLAAGVPDPGAAGGAPVAVASTSASMADSGDALKRDRQASPEDAGAPPAKKRKMELPDAPQGSLDEVKKRGAALCAAVAAMEPLEQTYAQRESAMEEQVKQVDKLGAALERILAGAELLKERWSKAASHKDEIATEMVVKAEGLQAALAREGPAWTQLQASQREHQEALATISKLQVEYETAKARALVADAEAGEARKLLEDELKGARDAKTEVEAALTS